MFEEIKGRTCYRALHVHIPGSAAGVPQGKIRKQKTGDSAFLYDVAGRTHNNGRYAVFFQMTGNQTHGLVAHRSKRRQEHGIHTVFLQPFKDLRRILGSRPALAVFGGYAVEAR